MRSRDFGEFGGKVCTRGQTFPPKLAKSRDLTGKNRSPFHLRTGHSDLPDLPIENNSNKGRYPLTGNVLPDIYVHEHITCYTLSPAHPLHGRHHHHVDNSGSPGRTGFHCLGGVEDFGGRSRLHSHPQPVCLRKGQCSTKS